MTASLFRHYTDVPAARKGAVWALGNFDGVHQGHKAVLSEAVRIAHANGTPSGMFTFFPHPLALLAPAKPRLAISSVRQKYHHARALGLDMMLAQHFTLGFSHLTGTEFIEQVLCAGVEASHLVIGYDFIFGRGRSGNAELLQHYADQGRFGLTHVTAHQAEGAVVSSTRIREALMQGDIAAAERLLGHGYAIEGRVCRGEGKAGPLLGVPTANIPLEGTAHPAYGVYQVEVTPRGEAETYPGIANIGVKPSFGEGKRPLLEVHLQGITRNLYGKPLTVRLLRFIRPERRFETLEALKAQIAEDVRGQDHNNK